MTGIHRQIWRDLPGLGDSRTRYRWAQGLWDEHQLIALEATADLAGALVSPFVGPEAERRVTPQRPPDSAFEDVGERDYHLELARLSWNHIVGRLASAVMRVDDPALPSETGALSEHGGDAVFWLHYWAIWGLGLMAETMTDEAYERRIDQVLADFVKAT